ncbi:hypothetical protein HN873_040161 [Arachis hypogaea]
MTKLKLLQLAGVQPNREFKHAMEFKHSRYLRWMSWHGFSLRHTPIDCYQPNLISIELENSKLRVLWKRSPLLKQLKILNLSHSHDLIKTPDFSYLPNLEKLVLKDCTELSSISYTIGTLKNILHINIEGCTNLSVLPRSIYKLTSLETLLLSGCSKIDKLEEDVEQMESLAVLKADNTAIAQVPGALARLRNLGHVSLCGYEGLACDVIPLIMFWLWTSPNNMLSSVIQKCSSNVFTYANWGPRLQIKGDVSLDTDNVSTCNELVMHISESKSSLNSLLTQMGVDNSFTEILQKTISQMHDPDAVSDMIYQYAIAQDEFTKNENLIMDVSGNFLTRAEAAAAAPGSWIVNNGSDVRMRECYCLSPYIMESLASKFEEFLAGEYFHLNSIIGDNPYWKENNIRDQNLLMGAILWKHHWWCYALDRSQKKLYVLDSIHCEPPNEDSRKLDKLVSLRLEELLEVVDPKYKVSNKGFSIVYADVPKQSNGNNVEFFAGIL